MGGRIGRSPIAGPARRIARCAIAEANKNTNARCVVYANNVCVFVFYTKICTFT